MTGEGIIKWLEPGRFLKTGRLWTIKTVGLSHNDTKGIIDVCKGLSLNDSYWVVPADFYDFAETDNGSLIVNIMHPG